MTTDVQAAEGVFGTNSTTEERLIVPNRIEASRTLKTSYSSFVCDDLTHFTAFSHPGV